MIEQGTNMSVKAMQKHAGIYTPGIKKDKKKRKKKEPPSFQLKHSRNNFSEKLPPQKYLVISSSKHVSTHKQ